MDLLSVFVDTIYLVLPMVFLPIVLIVMRLTRLRARKMMHRELTRAGLINPKKLYQY